MDLFSDDQRSLQQLIRDYCKKEIAPRAAHYDHSEEFPWDNVKGLAALGLMGMPIPEEYGGAGLDNLSYTLAVEEVSKACAATGAIMSIHISAGILPILLFGSEEQKKKYIPPMAAGGKIGAFALTEANAGSDAGAVRTTAVLDGESYVINGTKCFISNAGPAEIYSVFAKTTPGKGVKGISGFIVEKGTSGFSIGKKEEKMGIRASATAELIFENCRIPKENLLGNEGEGFKIAMVVLDSARIGVGAQAVGIAQAAYEEALAYAKVREQFGRPIAANQAIGFMLADMAIKIEAARQLLYYAARLKDVGAPFGKEAAMCKTFASDMAVQVALDAIQIMGGYGYSREYPVERLLRDAKITQIYEGTNQIQRVVIANHILS